MLIRNYKPTDFNMLQSWWASAKEPAPLKTMYCEDTTFILEDNKTPVVSLTIYLTNCKDVAYLENFVGNPEIKGEKRKLAGQQLLTYVEKFAKGKGYKYLLCLCYKDSLKKRYQEMGMIKTLDNVSTFVRKVI